MTNDYDVISYNAEYKMCEYILYLLISVLLDFFGDPWVHYDDSNVQQVHQADM